MGSFRPKSLLTNILWKSRSRLKLLAAAFGVGLGFLLLLGALQVYFDLQTLLGGSASDQFVQINKRVNLVNTLGARAVFSAEEVAEIAEQPFLESLGEFKSNSFKVGAGSNAFGFYTELFFEAIPNEFIDIETASFKWEEGDEEVPIILSRDYLALYNFGFAPSQGLPQFTPNTIKRVSIDLMLRGNSRQTSMTGRIVGFSDRINSILVPEGFISWANERYGASKSSMPSRLMLKVDNPLSKEFRDFLKERNYELSTGRLVGGEAIAVVGLIIGILAFLGFLIALLSLMVVNLNYQLVIAQASDGIKRLYELGYTRDELGVILNQSSLKWYGLSWLAAVLALQLIHLILARILAAQGFDILGFLHPIVWGAALVLAIGFFITQRRNIRATLNTLFT